MSNASKVTRQLRERLECIRPDNGYSIELKAIYFRHEKVPENPPKPYAMVRVVSDRRTSTAGFEATRLRTLAIEIVFAGRTDDDEVDRAGVDVLRALGFGRVDLEDKLPGLVDDEDEAEFTYPDGGLTTRSIITSIGVTYVENYN
ncbi:hypothetical protein [Pseudomonas sp. BN515]|uniref:hypothetical protein n=1 Tax=Pseudomonas sp. BN515 TaxID=2567892 RepID=UPI00245848FC|nr:hypothetical protein [Pseudomonas sp. BN515]MDH4873018.1 hypothetical protein [Pseudomonas sp. BN515]